MTRFSWMLFLSTFRFVRKSRGAWQASCQQEEVAWSLGCSCQILGELLGECIMSIRFNNAEATNIWTTSVSFKKNTVINPVKKSEVKYYSIKHQDDLCCSCRKWKWWCFQIVTEVDTTTLLRIIYIQTVSVMVHSISETTTGKVVKWEDFKCHCVPLLFRKDQLYHVLKGSTNPQL